MRRKFRIPFIPTVIAMVVFAAGLLWFINPARVSAGFQILPISLRSPLNADYSADPRSQIRLRPLQLDIIEEAIQDRQISANAEEILVELSTPVPTITLLPGAFTATALPSLIPTGTFTEEVPQSTPTTQPSFTLTVTVTLTETRQPTVTFPVLPSSTSTVFVPTLPPTQGPTNTSVPPTRTPVPPTNTSIPPTPTPQPTAYPPPATSVPPTFIPPTSYP